MSNKGLFEISDDGSDAIVPKTGTDAFEPRVPSHMEHRSSTLGDIASGKVEDKVYLWVDPAVCRMWSGHNRRYDLLSMEDEKVAELVEGIKTQGRQEIPAVVRAVNDGSGYQYEVIAGARRHWAVSWLRANNYPSFKYLIDVRDLTDEECFRFADMENRDRDDVSDYERAVDYKKAIGLYYGGIDSRMAERIGYTNANLSYLLRLAELPQEIIDAFHDPRQITVRNGRALYPLLKDSKARRKLLAKATDIGKAQKVRVGQGEPPLPGKDVVKELLAAPKERRKPEQPTQYCSDNGNVIIQVDKEGPKELRLILKRGDGVRAEDVRAAVERMLEALF